MAEGLAAWAQRAATGHLAVGRLVREAMRAMEAQGLEDVDPDEAAEVVERDPALTLHVVGAANAVEHRHLDSEVGTVRHAALMLGTARLFPLARTLPVDDEVLRGDALEGYRHAVARARRAAVLARDWARQRGDQLPEEVYVAALVPFAGELAAWTWEPQAMVAVEEAVSDGIAREDAEYIVLGCALARVSAAVARVWGLPPLGVQALDPANALQPRTYGVMLAAELGAALDRGWADPVARATLAQAAAWLETGVTALEGRARELLAEAGLAVPESVPPPPRAHYALAPRPDRYAAALAALAEAPPTPVDRAVELALDALHEGLGLNRVVYARLVRHGEALRAHRIRGTEHSPAFNRFELALLGGHLFAELVERGGCLRVSAADEGTWRRVPEAVRELVGVPVFLTAAVRRRGEAVGLLYADRRHPDLPISGDEHARFAAVVERLEQTLSAG